MGMIVRRLVFGCTLLLAAERLQALDLTPESSERILEGVHIPLVLFHDSDTSYTYQPPNNWRSSGGGTAITFFPVEQAEALMKLQVIKHAPGTHAIADIPSEDFVKWSRSRLPANAEDIKVVSENPNVFALAGKPARELVFSYKAGGQRFQTSVAALDWNERELFTAVVTALSTDFPTVYSAANGSLFSWTKRENGS